MANVGMQKEERKLLIGSIVVLAVVVLLLLGWTLYLFIGMMKLNLAMMKELFTNNPEAIVYVFGPLLVLLWILLQMFKIWKDISSNSVDEGTADVVKVWRSWPNRDWVVTLSEPGREKVKIYRKDAYKIARGEKIKFRITPSGILIGYEILKKK